MTIDRGFTYTKEDLFAMEPGPVLDALVTEKLLGKGSPVKPYSTDPAAAFELIDWFQSHSIHVYTESWKSHQGVKTHACWFFFKDDWEHGSAASDSFPLAVCRAVLKVVGSRRLRLHLGEVESE